MEKSSFSERLKSTGRNDPCPCGSGKKYKKCHLLEDEATQYKELKKQEEIAAAADKSKKEESEDVASNKKDSKVKHPMLKSIPKSKMGPKDKTFNIPRRSAV